MDRLLDYLPEIYRDLKDYQELAKVSEQNIDETESEIDRFFDNQFVMTSDDSGLLRREKVLNIQANPFLESIDFRIARIINRYTTKPPFTIRYLQRQLDSLVGKGRTYASIEGEAYLLTVITSIDDAPLFREIEETVKTTIPANLIYRQQTSIRDTVVLKERVTRKEVLRNYKLNGSWKLGSKPFASYGTEVIIID